MITILFCIANKYFWKDEDAYFLILPFCMLDGIIFLGIIVTLIEKI